MPVERLGGESAGSRRPPPLRIPPTQLAVRRGERGLTGSDDDRAPAAVDDQLLPVDQQEHIRPEPDRHRHAERSGDDRGVRRRGPVGERDRDDAVRAELELGHLARTEIARDQDGSPVETICEPGSAAEDPRHPAAELADVGRPRGEQRVVERGERRGVLRHRFLRGARGRDPPGAATDSGLECRILRHQHARLDDLSLVGQSCCPEPRGHPPELLDGLGERGERTTGLVAVACSRRVVPHASHDEGTADRDPGGRPEAVVHAFAHGAATLCSRAAMINAVDVAPGSWWPMLRSPR